MTKWIFSHTFSRKSRSKELKSEICSLLPFIHRRLKLVVQTSLNLTYELDSREWRAKHASFIPDRALQTEDYTGPQQPSSTPASACDLDPRPSDPKSSRVSTVTWPNPINYFILPKAENDKHREKKTRQAGYRELQILQ